MENNRLQKVNQLLQQDLAEIFRLMSAQLAQGLLISVTEVRTSPDLSVAKVFVSIFPSDKRDAVMKVIQENKSKTRNDLGKKVGKQMRVVPDLILLSDTTLDQVDQIDRELKGKGDNPIL